MYGGGGGTGATYKNDYIELFNRGTTAVSITGWSVQYASATGSSWSRTNLTTTQITSPTITVKSTGNALPAPVVVGTGGRIPPATVIEDDANGTVETGGVFDPNADGIDFWESLEGMRVQLNNARVVGPKDSHNEIPVVGDNGANAGLLNARGGITIRPSDFNPERIILDDVLAPMPPATVGDVMAAIIGVIDYSFGNYKLLPSATPAITANGLAKEVTAAAGPGQLMVGTMNIENLAPSDPQTKFDGLAGVLVNNLKAPDIVAVQEIQDNNGATNDAVVAADQTWRKLINAITAAGGPTYAYRQIDPGNSAWNSSRKALAAEFMWGNHHLFVINNHFNSKGGDQPLFGVNQPPARSSETQRHSQATIVHNFVQQAEFAALGVRHRPCQLAV